MIRAINKRELNWAIQRMSRIIRIWAKLDHADRIFLLGRFRSERPQEFREVVGANLLRSFSTGNFMEARPATDEEMNPVNSTCFT